MKKIFSVLVLSLAFCAFTNAESVTSRNQFTSFTGIKVTGNFDVTLKAGVGYSVDLNIDSRVSDYCRVYLQGLTLVFELVEKEFPKELKAQLRKRNSAPLSLKAEITMPMTGMLQEITLIDNAKLRFDGQFSMANGITVNVKDNAALDNVSLKTSQAEISVANKARVDGTVQSNNVQIKSSNSSIVALKVTGSAATSTLEGSSQQTIDASLSDFVVKGSGNSVMKLKGHTNSLTINSKGNSELDSRTAVTNSVYAVMQNCTAAVAPKETLSLNLSSGAKLTFAGNPRITIETIKSSSVLCDNVK